MIIPPVLLKYFLLCRHNIRFTAAKKKLQNSTQLHLACGSNLLSGWQNIDLDGPKGIIRLDLSKSLPVASNTIRFIFSEHFIEHINLSQGRRFLSECYRVLQPGGILRLSTPSLEVGVRAYMEKSIGQMKYDKWIPKTPCQMLNEGMRLWNHQFVYDLEEITLLLKECGFSNIEVVEWHKSRYPELREIECRPYRGEIIVEAEKQSS